VKLNPGLSRQNSVQQEECSFHQQIGLKWVKRYIWSIAFYGAETWTLRKVDQEFLRSFKMCCWRWKEKIGWTSDVRNEEVLQTAKEEMNILRTIKLRKANWIGYILHRNCPLTHVIEWKIAGRIQVTGKEEEDVSSYWINACKREDTGNWKRKHWIPFSGELALEEAMDVSLRHYRVNEFIVPWYCYTRCSWILCRCFINLKLFSILLEFYYKEN